jgi:subtilisin-like proprotein convertase family protein
MLHWGRANFFLAVPYRLGRPKLTLSPRSPARGTAVNVSIRLKIPASSPARHAVLIRLFAPDGAEARWARQVVLLENGRAAIQLPVAFNDAAGTWRLRATELFSGKEGAAKYSLAK